MSMWNHGLVAVCHLISVLRIVFIFISHNCAKNIVFIPYPFLEVFAVKLMILVLEDRYESPLSIDTEKVPVALHLTLQ